MKIVIGSDHRGFENKKLLMQDMQDITWLDVGCDTPERCDFPEYAAKVAHAVQANKADVGILMCGSGIGMSIAANRFKGIYAALIWNPEVAKLSKEHNDANVLILPGDFLSLEEIQQCIKAWMQADFLGGRYQERLIQIDELID